MLLPSRSLTPEDCQRDPCVVETDGVAVVISRFVALYEREAAPACAQNLRSESGAFAGRDPEAITALDALAARTAEVDVAGVGVAKEKLRRLLERRYRTTELRIADLVVTAAGAPMAFYDGTISKVIPNPRSPKSERLLCCGGSTSNGH